MSCLLTDKSTSDNNSKADFGSKNRQMKDIVDSHEPIVSRRRRSQQSSNSFSSQHDDSLNPGLGAMFSSIRDVEEIRRIAAAHCSFSPSEESTSSHISCPDPSSFTDGCGKDHQPPPSYGSPALYPRTDLNFNTSPSKVRPLHSATEYERVNHNLSIDDIIAGDSQIVFDGETDLEMSQASTTTVIPSASSVSSHDELNFGLPTTRPRSRRVTEDENISLSPQSLNMPFSPSKAILVDDATIPLPQSSSVRPIVSVYPSSSPSSVVSHRSIQERPQEEITSSETTSAALNTNNSDCKMDTLSLGSPRPRGRTYEEICATLPPLKLDALEQDAILKKVLQEFDDKADQERAARLRDRDKLLPQQTSPYNDKSDHAMNSNEKPTEVTQTSIQDPASHTTTATAKGEEDVNNVRKLAVSCSNNKGLSSNLSDDNVSRSTQKPKQLPVLDNDNDIDDKEEPCSTKFSNNTPLQTGDPRKLDIHQNNSNFSDLNRWHVDKDMDIYHQESNNETECEKQSPDHLTGPPGNCDSHFSPTGHEEELSFSSSTEAVGVQALSNSYGNSLNSMMGWSSEIETHKEEKKKRNKTKSRGELNIVLITFVLKAVLPSFDIILYILN